MFLALLVIAFMPKDFFNQILYSFEHAILRIEQRKVIGKEEQGKAIEKNLKPLEQQDKAKAKSILRLKKQKEQIKPSESLQELKKESARLGYPTK